MPAETDQPTLAVTQADREAAADAVKAYRDKKNANWQQRIRKGECDDGVMVQAFARHRTNSEPRPAGDLREAISWPEPKFVPVESGARLNPERVTAAFQLIHGEMVIGEQFKLVEMILDGTEYTVATHSPAPMAGERWQDIDDAARNGKYQWVGRGGDFPFADWLRWDGARWMFSDGSHMIDDGRYGKLVYHPLPAPPAAAHPSTQEGADRG